jgi:hypothetical protein
VSEKQTIRMQYTVDFEILIDERIQHWQFILTEDEMLKFKTGTPQSVYIKLRDSRRHNEIPNSPPAKG